MAFARPRRSRDGVAPGERPTRGTARLIVRHIAAQTLTLFLALALLLSLALGLASVLLNRGEGAERRGADRLHFYRIAAGSAAEVRSALDAAEALGFVEAAEVAEARDRFDQVVRILRAITR